jgi:hypothetical protein
LRASLQRAAATFLAAQAERLDEAGLLDSVRPLAAAAGLELRAGSDPSEPVP